MQNRWYKGSLDYSLYTDGLHWTSEVLYNAIQSVRESFPFWNASRGSDHFVIFTMDLGRCDAITLLPEAEVEDLIVVSTMNEIGSWRAMRWVANNSMVEVSCFRNGHDLTIPAYYLNGSVAGPTHPLSTSRDTALLLRFGERKFKEMSSGKLRMRLLEYFKEGGKNPFSLGKVVAGEASKLQTDEDMRHAILCVCPPGRAQHTGRFYRAILHGCIPVTFYDDVDLPFARLLGVDYSSFLINFDPSGAARHMHSVAQLLQSYLSDPELIQTKQRSLAAVQHMFNWDRLDPVGVQASFLRDLSMVAKSVTRRHSRRSCNVDSIVEQCKGRVQAENERYWQEPLEHNPYRARASGRVPHGRLTYLGR